MVAGKVLTILGTVIAVFIFVKLLPTPQSSALDGITWKKVLIIGDSNVQFGYGNQVMWVRLLADRLQRLADVVNRGFEGYNTRFLRLILPQILSEFTPKELAGVILLMGTNDALTPDVQHLPVEMYEKHYQSILDYLYQFGMKKENIVIITPPMSKFEPSKLNTTEQTLSDYVDKCREIAMTNQIAYIDLYGLMQKSLEDIDLLLYDGIHISPMTSNLLYDNIWPLLDVKLIRTKEVQLNFPDFREIRYKEPLETLPQFA